MARRFNGGIIGLLNAPTRTGGAYGLWTQNEVGLNTLAGTWPNPVIATQIFTTSQTVTIPSGVSSVDYLVVAGGAGGCSGTAGPAFEGGGAGGGAGGFLTGAGIPVVGGQTCTVVIGSGGARGASPPGNQSASGSNGTNSGVFLTASGASVLPWAYGGGTGASGPSTGVGQSGEIGRAHV